MQDEKSSIEENNDSINQNLDSNGDRKTLNVKEFMKIYGEGDENLKNDLKLSIGYVSELKLIKEFVKNEIDVVVPYGNNQRYDLITDYDEKLNRIQVKTAKLNKNGTVSFNPFSISKGKYSSYINEIDYFGVHCPENDKSFLIPIDKIKKQNKFKRFSLSKEDQSIFNTTTIFANRGIT